MREFVQLVRDSWNSLDWSGRLAAIFIAVFLWLAFVVIPVLTIVQF